MRQRARPRPLCRFGTRSSPARAPVATAPRNACGGRAGCPAQRRGEADRRPARGTAPPGRRRRLPDLLPTLICPTIRMMVRASVRGLELDCRTQKSEWTLKRRPGEDDPPTVFACPRPHPCAPLPTPEPGLDEALRPTLLPALPARADSAGPYKARDCVLTLCAQASITLGFTST